MTPVEKQTSSRLLLLGAAAAVALSACGSQVPAPAAVAPGEPLPSRAAFGEKRVNPDDGREFIFDGAAWVPHDATVEAWYGADDALRGRAAVTKELVTIAPNYCSQTYICGVSPGHVPHAAFLNDCGGCHRMEGFGALLWFEQPVNPDTGLRRPAYLAGDAAPLPTISGTDGGPRTCSNVACHGVPAGTFSYFFPDGSGEPTFNTVDFGGVYATTPVWGTTGNTCTACHGNPPRNGAWHGGQHAGGPTAATNQCQFCHPDATGSNGRGTAITNLSLHLNGVVNVQARFKSSCFGCH